VVKFASKLIQSTPNYDGDKFFTTVDGKCEYCDICT
jgi:hypothetical protein